MRKRKPAEFFIIPPFFLILKQIEGLLCLKKAMKYIIDYDEEEESKVNGFSSGGVLDIKKEREK